MNSLCAPNRALRLLQALLLVTLAGVASGAVAGLRVVTTLPDLAAIASAIGGDDVDVTALVLPSQDPHYVDARPNLLIPMSRADLLIVNGLELEIGWLPPLITNARNRDILPGARGHLDVSTVVERMDVPQGRIDRSMGDVHPGGNPHFTFDPRRARDVAVAVRDRFIELDRPNTEAYMRRANAFVAQLDELIRDQRQRFAELPRQQRRVVTYHRSLIYLLDWLDVEDVMHIEPRPGIDPTPQHTARVLQVMRNEGIRVVLQEEFYRRNVSQTLCDMSGATLVVIPGGTRFAQRQSYIDHLRGIADALHAALSAH